jgi:RNA polymerase sigma-70 factor (ECF subfamily)
VVNSRGLEAAGEQDRRDMAELAGGSQEALERLYGRYASRLTGFFWRLGKRGGEVDDLVHEVFVRLWRHGRGWRGEGRLTTYLFGIAKSVWLDARSAGRREISLEDFPRASAPATPDRELERRELGRQIERAVSGLAEPLRLVFSMATAGGLKYREIAELLGIPLGTVKSRMAAAEDKLREALSGYLGVKREEP